MTLHGQAKEDVAAYEAARRSGVAANRGAAMQRDEEAEERMNTGFIVPVSIGVTVYTNPAKLRGADDEIAQQTGAMKGIVLDGYSYRKEDGHYAVGWRVFNPIATRWMFHKRFPHWPESVLDPWRTERTDPHQLVGYWRRMLVILAQGSGLPTEGDARIAEDAHRILRVLMTEGGRK